MKERMKDYAAIESRDSGGTINKCGADAFLAQRQMAWFGQQAANYNQEPVEIEGMQREGRSFNFTVREPMGVCAAIIPWNAPLLLTVTTKFCTCLVSARSTSASSTSATLKPPKSIPAKTKS